MLSSTFAWEIKDLILQFMDAMDNVVIRRFNSNREAIDKVRVTMIYSPKQRVIFDLQNKEKTIVLPIISVYQGGISRDADRVFNKIDGSYYDPDFYKSNYAEHLRQPLPINLTLNVSILARYQSDIDQILTNFIPYFDPYIVIEWSVPEFKHRINTHVFWSENINLTYPTEINADTAWNVSADTSFIVKGWIFKAPPKGVGKIYTIKSNYASIKDIPQTYINLSTDPGLLYRTDNFAISARPQPKLLEPITALNNQVSPQHFTLLGDMFTGTTNIFLSGSTTTPSFSGLSSIDLFSLNTALSSLYPAFSAVPVESFTVINNNKIDFIIPHPIHTGVVDVIVLNMAGYGKLKVDSIIPTYNPFLSGSPDFNNYVQPETPSISGLRVV